MKLYMSPTSPYSRKARVVAREKGLAPEEIIVNPWESPGELVTRNPLSRIPVLEQDSGRCLFDSKVIVEYLDSLNDSPRLIPPGEDRFAVLSWQALADGIMDAVLARMRETQRPETQRSEEWAQRQEAALERALDVAAADCATPLVGKAFTLADIALGVALEYVDLRYGSEWRAAHPGLAEWHEGVAARESFRATAPPAQ
jgi:glutathione S-transferase